MQRPYTNSKQVTTIPDRPQAERIRGGNESRTTAWHDSPSRVCSILSSGSDTGCVRVARRLLASRSADRQSCGTRGSFLAELFERPAGGLGRTVEFVSYVAGRDYRPLDGVEDSEHAVRVTVGTNSPLSPGSRSIHRCRSSREAPIGVDL